MTDFEINVMNKITIDTITHSIISEIAKWQLKPADYITLVNALMDQSLNKTSEIKNESSSKIVVKKTELKLPLIGEHIQIKIFNKLNDVQIVKRWLDDEIGRWFLLSRSYTRDTTLNQLIDDERNILGIITVNDSHPIGLMGYLDHDITHGKAEMRKLIGEKEYREKGFAKEATQLWINYGISNLNLKKIYVNTIENNIRNVTLNKELGFQIEGILRKECLVDNKYYDLLRMALIVD
jgi:RimJ/RimL family protein N-acetyltransferase